MKTIQRKELLTLVISFVFLSVFIFPDPAHAYLDMGTGSFALQVMLAALFAAVFAIKSYLNSIKIFISKLFKRETDLNEDEN